MNKGRLATVFTAGVLAVGGVLAGCGPNGSKGPDWEQKAKSALKQAGYPANAQLLGESQYDAEGRPVDPNLTFIKYPATGRYMTYSFTDAVGGTKRVVVQCDQNPNNSTKIKCQVALLK